MRLTRSKVYLFLGWTSLVTGVVFLIVAAGFAAYEGLFLIRSSKAHGVVIASVAIHREADTQTGEPAKTLFCPQFQYQSADGVVHAQTSSTCSDPPGFTVGDHVQVNYLKTNSANAQIDSFGDKWGFVVIFGIFGIVLTPIGAVLLRRLRSQEHSLDPISSWED